MKKRHTHKIKNYKKYKNSTLYLIDKYHFNNRTFNAQLSRQIQLFLNRGKRHHFHHHAEDVILNNQMEQNNIYFSIYISLFYIFQVKALPSLTQGKTRRLKNTGGSAMLSFSCHLKRGLYTESISASTSFWHRKRRL